MILVFLYLFIYKVWIFFGGGYGMRIVKVRGCYRKGC